MAVTGRSMSQTVAMTRSMTRRPGRPVGGQLDITSQAVLDAAERVILRDGAGASIDAVAAEAGITKPIVYARVGSRADLATALAQRLAERLVVAVSAAMSGQSFSRSALRTFVEANLVTVAANRELFLYVTGGSTDQTSLGRLSLASTSTEPLASVLAAWRAPGELDPDVARSWAYGIVGMLQMASLWVIGDPSRDPREVADHLAALLWSGLGGQGVTYEP